MFESILNDIRVVFRHGHMVKRLMLINFVVWIAVKLLDVTIIGIAGRDSLLFEQILHKFCMPAQWQEIFTQPWGLLTSMFLHEDFMHLLVNLVFLNALGSVVGDLLGDRRVLPIYIIGGLAGAFLFMLSHFWQHYSTPYALGASGAVMALAGAAVTLNPEHRLVWMFIGEVKLKYVVLVLVLLDFVGIAHDSNTGGHVAHIGGFLTGIFLISRLREGVDLIEPVANFLNRVFNWFNNLFDRKTRRPKPHTAFKKHQFTGNRGGSAKSDNHDLNYQEKLDAILDKIKENGYDNLSQEEKDFLFDASKR